MAVGQTLTSGSGGGTMDPITLGGAGIMAGGQLLSGLLAQAAAAKKAKDDREAQALQEGFKMQSGAANQMGQAQASGLQGLIESYKQALARPPVL